ncbi:MAG: cytochrome c [Pirellulales bacterium]|nr:cytochrome c [Pirellulales bacterium]
MWNRTNIFLAACLVAVLCATLFERVDYSHRNVEFLPEMKYSPAWSSFEPNPQFANGQTLQLQPEGTLARGQNTWHYAATPVDAARAGEEVINPYQARIEAVQANVTSQQDSSQIVVASRNRRPNQEQNQTEAGAISRREQPANDVLEIDPLTQAQNELSDSIVRGGEIYRISCACCHGSSGAGDGPVAQRGFPPPPSLLTGRSRRMKDGQLFHIVTSGQGSMASFAPQLTFEQRWDVINFIRDLQDDASTVQAR